MDKRDIFKNALKNSDKEEFEKLTEEYDTLSGKIFCSMMAEGQYWFSEMGSRTLWKSRQDEIEKILMDKFNYDIQGEE